MNAENRRYVVAEERRIKSKQFLEIYCRRILNKSVKQSLIFLQQHKKQKRRKNYRSPLFSFVFMKRIKKTKHYKPKQNKTKSNKTNFHKGITLPD